MATQAQRLMDVLDPWRAAKLLMDNLGIDTAAEHASRRISDLTMQGDKAGAEVWSEILAAMAALRMRRPPDGLFH